jgi:two-component system sensor histidine kinase RegB
MARVRWATAAIETTMAATAWFFPALDFPLRQLALLMLVAAAANAGVAVMLARRRFAPPAIVMAALLVDVFLLAGLLDLTGGPFNPFSVVFVAQATLAGLTLGAIRGTLVGASAALCLGYLIVDHAGLDAVHHRLNDVPTHLFIMWLTVVATAELAAHFMAQASDALARREDEIDAMRQRAARADRLVALTTLAAGAAHELSTPLATIALASRELQHAAEARRTVPDLAEDARLIRTEVDRCQAILDQMSGRAGGTAADALERINVASILADVRARLSPDQRERLDVVAPTTTDLYLPRAGLFRAVLTLVTNALDAAPGSSVTVDVSQNADRLRLTVRDCGPGMAPEVLKRAGEPFFTTKPAGRGLGLGLFLARVFAERVGGSLTLHSDRGTTAQLDLPNRAESLDAA